MAKKIIMPQGGQDLQFGTIVQWLKKEGETVEKNELICEVETEKAVFEVNAPEAGVLIKILKQDGEEAEVLSTIGYVGQPGESVDIPEVVQKSEPAALEETAPKLQPEKLPGERMRISPRARKLAQDNGIDYTTIQSNRPDGKITSEMVMKAIQQAGLGIDGVEHGRMVKMNRAQRVAADRLTKSWQQAPHFFITVSVDMTEVLAQREAHNSDPKNTKVSINDLVIKAAANALVEFPEINASFYDADTIVLWEDINIGVATATEKGLFVPVIANADQLSLSEIAEKSNTLSREVRAGNYRTDLPSRFTISNLGMYGVDRFTAIINPPESAILAVGSAQKKAVVGADEQILVRDVMEMTLSLDHRVGDGALAAQFVNHIKHMLKNFEGLNK